MSSPNLFPCLNVCSDYLCPSRVQVLCRDGKSCPSYQITPCCLHHLPPACFCIQPPALILQMFLVCSQVCGYAVRDLQSLPFNVVYAVCTVFSQPASISHHQPQSPCNTSFSIVFYCEQREGPSIPSHQIGQCCPLHLLPDCLCVPLPALIHLLSLAASQVFMCAGRGIFWRLSSYAACAACCDFP